MDLFPSDLSRLSQLYQDFVEELEVALTKEATKHTTTLPMAGMAIRDIVDRSNESLPHICPIQVFGKAGVRPSGELAQLCRQQAFEYFFEEAGFPPLTAEYKFSLLDDYVAVERRCLATLRFDFCQDIYLYHPIEVYKRLQIELSSESGVAALCAYCREIGKFSPSKACNKLHKRVSARLQAFMRSNTFQDRQAAASTFHRLPPPVHPKALTFAGVTPSLVEKFRCRPSHDFLEALVTNTALLLTGSVIPCWLDEMVEISMLSIVHTLMVQDQQAACMAYLLFCQKNLQPPKRVRDQSPIYFLDPFNLGNQFLAMWCSSAMASMEMKKGQASGFGISMLGEEAARRTDLAIQIAKNESAAIKSLSTAEPSGSVPKATGPVSRKDVLGQSAERPMSLSPKASPEFLVASHAN